MNKKLSAAIVSASGLVAAFLGGCSGDASDRQVTAHEAQTGSGAPNGAHFNLNIIGVQSAKDVSNSGGDVIFVPLSGSCQINLQEGDFAVLDDNCTDDGKALFQLPNPDPTNSGTTTYSVYARALGKPGGTSTTQTCATDPTTGTVFCSVFTSVLTRTSGGSKFTNVSKELLFVFADTNSDGKLERFPLFDAALQNFYWSYSNNQLKLAQLRFYDVSTTVQ